MLTYNGRSDMEICRTSDGMFHCRSQYHRKEDFVTPFPLNMIRHLKEHHKEGHEVRMDQVHWLAEKEFDR